MIGVVTATAMGLKTGKSVMKNHLADEVPTVKPTELTSTEKTQLKYKYDPSDSEIEIKQPQIGDGPIIPTKAKFEEDGLIYEKSSNPFVKDRVTFEGKRLATTKSELVNQLKQLGIKKDDIMINENRKAGIKEWHDYLTKESTVKDDPFAQLMVLEEITKELKPDNAAVPPKLTHELFEETFNRALENGGSFAKFFNENSRSNAIEKYSRPEETVDGIKGRWVTIPKTTIDDPKYQEHVGYVQSLSDGTNWCIRFSQAETYIQKGDINFFVDADGKTQVCVREDSHGHIHEIQKRQQNATVPVPYIHVVNKFVQDKQLKGCEAQIKDAMEAKPKFDALRADIAKLQAENKYNEIFAKLGINVEHSPDGTFILSNYTAKIGDFTLTELGVDEAKLFANVSQIKGDADFSSSNLTNISNLTSVGGKFTFEGSNVNDIRNLSVLNGIRINWNK